MSCTQFTCPYCKQSLEVPDEMLGQSVECPSCGRAVRLPGRLPNPKLPHSEMFARSLEQRKKKIIAPKHTGKIIAPKHTGTIAPSRASGIGLGNMSRSQTVTLTDVQIPFVRMVLIILKWTLATIPALLLLWLIGFIIGMVLAALGVGLAGCANFLT